MKSLSGFKMLTIQRAFATLLTSIDNLLVKKRPPNVIRGRHHGLLPRVRTMKSDKDSFSQRFGIANLLSTITQSLTTAALVHNWAIYDPNLLKVVTSLLAMALFMAPRNQSSSVSQHRRGLAVPQCPS